MKIGLIFSSVFASPGYSGDKIFAPRELFTHLSDGLVAGGHSVFVFSAADTPTSAQLIPSGIDYLPNPPSYYKFRGSPIPEQTWLGQEYAKRRFELETIVRAFDYAKKNGLDIVHAYHDSSLFLTHYVSQLSSVPVLYSLHDPLPPIGSYEYQELSRFANHSYIAISESQKQSEGLALHFVATVYHGVQLTDFPFIANPSDSLLFMGRLMPEKGLHDAIAASLKTKIKLEIGTQFPAYHEANPYFDRQIKPFLDNVLIGEPGLVGEEKKARLYGNAKALLFPIHWEEPFGMVMIEAMACGTPVIAYNRGSVSEIVRDGVTGFIVEPEDQGDRGNTRDKGKWKTKKPGVAGLVEAIQRIGEIDRAACRAHVEEHFTVEKMVEGYEKVYEKILYGKSGK